jgi:hypothetical protein
MLTLIPAANDAGIYRDAAGDLGCAHTLGPIDGRSGLVERGGEVAGLGRRDIL